MKMLLASLLLGASLAHAGTTQTVLDVTVVGTSRADAVDASFQMDETTGMGYAHVTITQEIYSPYNWPNGGGYGGGYNCTPYGGCFPAPMPRPMPEMRVVYDKTVAVQGLSLHGDSMIFAGTNGDVDCGTMGYTRVFHRRAIFLSGNCSLTTSMNNGELIVNFNAK
jgi:hypothetical protein